MWIPPVCVSPTSRHCSQHRSPPAAPRIRFSTVPPTRSGGRRWASFLARALDLQAPRQQAGFADVDPSSVRVANIEALFEALFEAQITAGCTKDPLQYCPRRPIMRAQMAAFLYRARGLISAVRVSAGT